jgi:hypothetical protein
MNWSPPQEPITLERALLLRRLKRSLARRECVCGRTISGNTTERFGERLCLACATAKENYEHQQSAMAPTAEPAPTA